MPRSGGTQSLPFALLAALLAVVGCGRGALRPPPLVEASGLVLATTAAGWWSHNDSGGGPWLYRVTEDGGVVQTVHIEEATAFDWEDLTAVEREGERWLMIADTGDNWQLRPQLQLLAVPEPAPAARRVAVAWRCSLRFADGPRDVEGLAYDPLEDRLLLLSKRERPPRLYAIPVAAAHPNDPVVPEVLAPVDALAGPDRPDDPGLDWAWRPTALAIDATGTRLAIATIDRILLYERAPDEPWATALARPARRLPTPDLPQIEGLCFARRGRDLLLISEESERVHRLRLP